MGDSSITISAIMNIDGYNVVVSFWVVQNGATYLINYNPSNQTQENIFHVFINIDDEDEILESYESMCEKYKSRIKKALQIKIEPLTS